MAASSAEPYSSAQSTPPVNFWKRSMSITPTVGSATAKRSGRWLATAPIKSPPLDRP